MDTIGSISAPTSKQSIALPVGLELGDTKDRHALWLVGVYLSVWLVLSNGETIVFLVPSSCCWQTACLVVLTGDGKKGDVRTPTMSSVDIRQYLIFKSTL